MDYPTGEAQEVERGRDLQFWYRLLKEKGYTVSWAGAHGGRYLVIEPKGHVPKYHLYFCHVPQQQLFDVLDGKREATVMTGITRIIGYFSAVKNWNKGKLGELKDRQAGNYKVGT